MSRSLEITATAAHRDRFAHHSRAAACLLAAALVALGACGTVDVAPSAKGAGGNGVAGAGAPAGAAGGGGSFSAAGGAGGAPVAAAGSSGEASSGGAAGGAMAGGAGGGASSGGAGGVAGGSAGAPGVSDVQCPSELTVRRGCAGQIINGSPCDVCQDGGGALLRCSTDPRAGARMYCVPDCSYCHA
jgi:hypothetical protein